MRFISAAEVRERLTYEVCIPLMREAMIRLSRGHTCQLPRSILPLDGDNLFGVMSGGLGDGGPFGAKVVSVFPHSVADGGQSHQGYVLLFDGRSGRPTCVAEAGEVTAIRTAAVSAAATDVLARSDARHLAIIGAGEQARAHARAIAKVREIMAVSVWARDIAKARAYAAQMSRELAVEVVAHERASDAVAGADIVCTVTASRSPVVLGRWVEPGTHLNLVGSSVAGPVEVDHDVVAMSRFIVDSRENVLEQGAEFLAAKAAGRVGDDHLVGELGQVLGGELPGRRNREEITVFKSLGHIVQDIAAVEVLCSRPS